MKASTFVNAITIVALLSVSSTAAAIKVPGPPTRVMLAGSWVGADQSGAVLRLDLDADGIGRLIESDRGSALSVYSVALTTINIYKLSFSVRPAGGNAVGFTLSGVYHQHAIELQRTFKQGSYSWTFDAMLVHSGRLQAGVAQVSSASISSPDGSER